MGAYLLATLVFLVSIRFMPMSAALEASEVSRDQISTVARAMAKTRQQSKLGRSQAPMVRLNSSILPLIEGARAPGQSTVQFLKEAAITVALQRLEASQE